MAAPILKKYWFYLLSLNIVIWILIVLIDRIFPRTWTSAAQLILPDTTTNLDASLGTLGQLKDQGISFTNELNPLNVQTSIITSDDVIRPVWLSDPEKDKYRSLESYKKLFKVKPVDLSTTIQLKVTASLPELAQHRAESLINSYQTRLNKLRQGTALSRQQFNQPQIKQAEENLLLAKNRLADFKQATGLVSSEEQTTNLVEAIKTLRTTQAQVVAEAQARATRSTELSQKLRLTPQLAMNSLRLAQNKEYQVLRQKLSEVNSDIALSRGVFTEKHPNLISLLQKRQELVTALNRQLVIVVTKAEGLDTSFGGNNFKEATMDLIVDLVQVSSESQALQKQATIIQNQIQKFETELRAISNQQAQLSDLQRKYDFAEGVYKGIFAQLEQSKISAFDAYPNVQVLDQPTVDFKPTSPKRSLMFIGGVLASIFGSLALIYFLESRNSRLKQKDLQDIQLPILGRIPIFKSSNLKFTETEIPFQWLASTISLMELENQRLMVTSSTPGEGKTKVTLELAKALVLLGFRVLIVDGDFRKAKLSRDFGYTVRSQTDTSVKPLQISPGLDILPAIPQANHKEVKFIARGGFEKHLNAIQTAGNYDYVIVDSAPVSSTSETALMAKAVTNVLLVVRLEVSDRYMVQETLEQLMRHNAHIIGLVINGVEPRTDRYVYKQENLPIK
ncbi:MAG: P-loop NTPase [Desmonostoc vinosum HA7617-LM4]|jgi:uncharacterized protein involved in exopolysaccharide biosynthesis/Mrp family chromosome partitioning ATPase|nr:P-loop NTPase [Desmonostoc vinosum HA7617-LM4]